LSARHFSLVTARCLRQLDRYRALGIELVGVGGDVSGTRPLISPAAFREFIVPAVRMLSRQLPAAGQWAVNASDGDRWPVIDDFLAGGEVDGYLEIDQSAGLDLRRLKEAHGERITLFGNIDCGTTLRFASPAEIDRITRQGLADGRGRGGHIFCVSNAVTASVPLVNYLALVNAYRRESGLAGVAPS
jgi:uroporphyrinogen-III decarboxylase